MDNEVVKYLQDLTVRLLGLGSERGKDVAFAIWVFVGVCSALAWYWGRRYQRRQDGERAYKDLDRTYLSLYESALAHPFVIDPEVTNHFERLDREKRLRYEAYAYRVWVICETVFDALGLARKPSPLSLLRALVPTIHQWLPFNRDGARTGSFAEDLRRNAFISRSQFSNEDWKTWLSALDIEARLHLKWFVAEGRFRESFKDEFKLGVLRRYGAEYGTLLTRHAKARYQPINPRDVLDELKGVLERLGDRQMGLRCPATREQVTELVRSWWREPGTADPATDGSSSRVKGPTESGSAAR